MATLQTIITTPTPTPTPTIRRPHPDEAPILTDLALSAKAYWGYDASFMAAARAELTITASDIAQHDIYVATLPRLDHGKEGEEGEGEEQQQQQEIVGVYRITPHSDSDSNNSSSSSGSTQGELSYLWIRPDRIGCGLGRSFWEDALRRAAARRLAALTVDADPHAEGFYLRMGARRCGRAASRSIPGRALPQLTVDVPRGPVAAALMGGEKEEEEEEEDQDQEKDDRVKSDANEEGEGTTRLG
ncbi:hypothetical protein V2A60_001379 [Cordyceps javanica]